MILFILILLGTKLILNISSLRVFLVHLVFKKYFGLFDFHLHDVVNVNRNRSILLHLFDIVSLPLAFRHTLHTHIHFILNICHHFGSFYVFRIHAILIDTETVRFSPLVLAAITAIKWHLQCGNFTLRQ